jgi:hypothetical protein
MSTQPQFDAQAMLKQIVADIANLKASVESIRDKLTIGELQSQRTDMTLASLVGAVGKLSETIVATNNMSENLLKAAPTKKVAGDKKSTLNITSFWSANKTDGGLRSFKATYEHPGESLGYYNRVPQRVLQEARSKKVENKTFESHNQEKQEQLVYTQAWSIMKSYADKHPKQNDPDYELCEQCRELLECVQRDLKAFQDLNGITTGKAAKKSDKSTPSKGESSSTDAVVPSSSSTDVDVTRFLETSVF